jgi:hypothetical protein
VGDNEDVEQSERELDRESVVREGTRGWLQLVATARSALKNNDVGGGCERFTILDSHISNTFLIHY